MRPYGTNTVRWAKGEDPFCVLDKLKTYKAGERRQARSFCRGAWEDEYTDPESEAEDREAAEQAAEEMREYEVLADEVRDSLELEWGEWERYQEQFEPDDRYDDCY